MEIALDYAHLSHRRLESAAEDMVSLLPLAPSHTAVAMTTRYPTYLSASSTQHPASQCRPMPGSSVEARPFRDQHVRILVAATTRGRSAVSIVIIRWPSPHSSPAHAHLWQPRLRPPMTVHLMVSLCDYFSCLETWFREGRCSAGARERCTCLASILDWKLSRS